MNEMRIYSINAALKVKDCRHLVIRDKNRNLWMAKIIPDRWDGSLPDVELYWQPFETGTFRSIAVRAPGNRPATVSTTSYGHLGAEDARLVASCTLAAAEIAEALSKMWLEVLSEVGLVEVTSYADLDRRKREELRKEISEERKVA